MMWLIIFILVVGYIIAMRKEIIMYFKMLWKKIKNEKKHIK